MVIQSKIIIKAFKVFGQNYEKYDELKRHFEKNPE